MGYCISRIEFISMNYHLCINVSKTNHVALLINDLEMLLFVLFIILIKLNLTERFIRTKWCYESKLLEETFGVTFKQLLLNCSTPGDIIKIFITKLANLLSKDSKGKLSNSYSI